jgi:methylenetetrahydrofolate--tRNA-(uracil-5-)-methyltransferase
VPAERPNPSTSAREPIVVVGGGLAGSECAFQLAERGHRVRLLEQKPVAKTPAQRLDGLAELVCSNSFRAEALHNAVGLLKEEMRRVGSVVMAAGDRTRVPAGGAYAVDREAFSAEITRVIDAHPSIERVVQIVEAIPRAEQVVLATGPLTGDALAADLARVVGGEHLAYYDAIAPVVLAETIDWERVFRASRYDKGGDDAYVNCPLDEAQYEAFVSAILEAEKVETRDFEEPRYFEGCLPIEVLAERGRQTLAFGCMKPVGLVDPRTGRRPHAVVQLRQENVEATAYNLVGFQTRMKWPEQKRIFRMIPGLEHAEFERLGSVHRNTFVDSPRVLAPNLSLRAMPNVRLAGQITGVEGYVESAACGLVVGITLASALATGVERLPPRESALGSLLAHLAREDGEFQPSNVVFSMFPPIEGKHRGKRMRRDAMVERALASIDAFAREAGSDAVLASLGRFAA